MQSNKTIWVDYNSPVKTGEKMKVRLRIANELGYVTDVKALFNRHGQHPGADAECNLTYEWSESTSEYSTFVGDIAFDLPGYRTFFIKLKLNNCTKEIRYDSNNEMGVISENPEFEFWELFVYYSDFKTPDEIKGGIMYQIFVDTFNSVGLPEHLKEKVVDWSTPPKWKPDSDGVYRNNQFYGGNLRGIIEKLPYLKKLNVTVLYSTPIFKSPSSNRYDTDDYEQIDEMVGTLEDAKELHQKANELGISYIIDVVLNHSGRGNRLLKEKPEMYSWTEDGKLVCWWGYYHLCQFNQHNRYYKEMVKSFLNYCKQFCDGVRCDVADNLEDSTLKDIRKDMKELLLLYFLGEVWKNAVTGDFREFFYGDELDGVMNYRFGNAIHRYVRWGNYKNFKDVVEKICRLYPPEALDVSPIFLSSHDTPRTSNILVGDFMKEDPKYENVWDMEKDPYWYDENGNFDTYRFREWEVNNEEIPESKKELAYRLQGLAVFLQYTLPGLPAVYAGEEAGAFGFKDPMNRKPFPWNNIDERRYMLYYNLGVFRMAYRSIFADSRNFKILYADKNILFYRRGDLKFILNRSFEPHRIDEYDAKDTIFTLFSQLKDVRESKVINPCDAIIIK